MFNSKKPFYDYIYEKVLSKLQFFNNNQLLFNDVINEHFFYLYLCESTEIKCWF